jgi:hypothetical protein
VKNRFQSLPFECNLQRYNPVPLSAISRDAALVELIEESLGGALHVESS